MEKAVKNFSRAMESTMFFGPQPFEVVLFAAGTGTACPMCEGYGHEDSGPGAWSCNTCNGLGFLVGDHHLERYLPYSEGHPNKGTEFDREGKWKA